MNNWITDEEVLQAMKTKDVLLLNDRISKF